MDLTTLRFGGIKLCTKPELARTMIFRDLPDALADEIPAEPNLPSFRSNTSQCDMNMRVLGVEVSHGYPFQWHPQVRLHLCDQIACQPCQVHSISKLWRDNQLPKPPVARLLPAF